MRELIDAAAVVGDELRIVTLAALSGRDPAEVEELTTAALSEGVLSDQRLSAAADLRFAHTILRRVVYDAIAHHRRRLLHARASSAMQAVYAGDLDRVAGAIGEHCEEADLHAEALIWSLRAGRVAAGRWQWRDAVLNLERANRALAATSGRNLDLQLALGEAYLSVGRLHDSERVLDAMVELATALGDDAALATALITLAQTRIGLGEYRHALETTERPPPTANAANGEALFSANNCPNCTYHCVDCHGDPSAPCALDDPVCYPCPHPGDRTKTMGLNIALYGSRKLTFESFVNGTMPMCDLTIQETMDMFQDLGINNPQAYADLNAYLAEADPRVYKIKGTLFTKGLGGSPIDVQACSDTNPSATAAQFTPLPFNVFKYEIHHLRSGNYAVSPFPYGSDPAVRGVIPSIFPGIQGCSTPDCILPPVCSTDIEPVDFHVSEETIYCDFANGNDANSGKSWEMAKKSMSEAMNAVRPGGEIWVAAGRYVGTVTVKPGVAMYGGFTGNENFREERNPEVHLTILDGHRSGPVVTMPAGGRVDGFTIENGASNSIGGGVQLQCGASVVANNAIRGNHAVSGGGVGVDCSRQPGATFLIVNNVIANNRADLHGGGVLGGAGGMSILNNRIVDNSASAGAGIHAVDGLIANNAVLRNRSTEGGGGIHATGAVELVNNTLVSNDTSPDHGGGIELTAAASSVVSNIIAFGSSGLRVTATGAPSLSNNCVFGNRERDYSGVQPGAGDINADPQFVGETDIRLRQTSPCIDAGDDRAVRAGWTDVAGEHRTLHARVDIGADESHFKRRAR